MSSHKSPVTGAVGAVSELTMFALPANDVARFETLICGIWLSVTDSFAYFMNPFASVYSSSNIKPATVFTDVFSTVIIVTLSPVFNWLFVSKNVIVEAADDAR